jgi:hypothetical protein
MSTGDSAEMREMHRSSYIATPVCVEEAFTDQVESTLPLEGLS